MTTLTMKVLSAVAVLQILIHVYKRSPGHVALAALVDVGTPKYIHGHGSSCVDDTASQVQPRARAAFDVTSRINPTLLKKCFRKPRSAPASLVLFHQRRSWAAGKETSERLVSSPFVPAKLLRHAAPQQLEGLSLPPLGFLLLTPLCQDSPPARTNVSVPPVPPPRELRLTRLSRCTPK